MNQDETALLHTLVERVENLRDEVRSMKDDQKTHADNQRERSAGIWAELRGINANIDRMTNRLVTNEEAVKSLRIVLDSITDAFRKLGGVKDAAEVLFRLSKTHEKAEVEDGERDRIRRAIIGAFAAGLGVAGSVATAVAIVKDWL